jgi:hypothetical protein
MPTVTYDGDSFKINGETATLTGDRKEVRFYPWISANESSSILFVASMRTETFRKGIENKISTQKTNLKTAFEAFKSYFGFLNSAEEQARVYAATGDVTDGTKAQEALTSANEEVENLKAAFLNQHTEKVLGLGSGRNVGGYPTSESKKITPNFLKKIIEESFKK